MLTSTQKLEKKITFRVFSGKPEFKLGIILLFLFFSVCEKTYAQSWLWAKGISGSGEPYASSVAVDPANGNVYTTGYFIGTVDFDPGVGIYNLTAVGFYDIFISKLDSSGNFLWAKEMGGTNRTQGFSIALDLAGSGDIYTTGWFEGTTDFDPGQGTFYLTSPNYYDWTVCSDPDCPYYPNSCFCPCYITVYTVAMFISKLDSSGNFLWAKALSASADESSVRGYSIVVDAEGSGDIYTSGSFEGTVDFDPGVGTFNLTTPEDNTLCLDWCLQIYYVCNAYVSRMFISKFDATGNFLWAKALSGNALEGDRSIAVDTSGSVYSIGAYVDGGTYISKSDASGNLVWEKVMDVGYANSIAVNIASGDVYASGSFSGTADFNPGVGTFNLTSVGPWDIFIVKLDGLGNFLWAKAMGGTSIDISSSMALDPARSGAVYTTGFFNETADFDPGTGIFNLISDGSADIFVSKLDSSGNFEWAKAAGGSSGDYGASLAINALNNVHVVGGFGSSSIMFDTIALINEGNADVFIAKLDGIGPPCISIVTSSSDSGSGSLRDIISCISSGAIITFDSSLTDQTILLTSGEIVINKNLNLSGLGILDLTISGNNASRIFHVLPGKNLDIENLSLKNATSLTNGGAIYVNGHLTLENVLLQNNFENGIPKSMTVTSSAIIDVIGNVEIKN